MAGWKDNPVMEWWDSRIYSGHPYPSWVKITDHNRSDLSVSIERIENKQRMANGTMRRYVVAKKRSWSTSWDNLPSKKVALLVNGESGEWMEDFHNATDGAFLMRIRDGAAVGNGTLGVNMEEFNVMISDFSKTVIKRGPTTDLWSLDITLEEV